ncbi:hypothetical protein KSP40_PGU015841 [Platanthera guangdongensis]|uniref:Uncharacterized protein n=1 Tax=Platanthera guangdongensis TaxID=2320717 RepID=A0ABR2M0A8_9ASPA
MASLALPLDSGESSHSLLSRRQSEMGSRYVVESGVFMSSLSATIFIVALVIIGVLMLTLLIALTVMLQSCKRSGSGVFDDAKKSNHHDHCNLFIFHAELNNLAASEIPIICKLHTFQFSKERYLRDLNTSLWFVEEYFSTLKPDKDGLDAILLDADDILSSTENLSSISSLEWIKQFEDMNHQARVLIVRLLVQLQASNWPFILFSRKPSKLFNTTWRTLIFSGYAGQSSLIMRSADEIEMESWEYLSSRRVQLQKQQFRIAGLISSQLDAFRGSCLGRRNFKLPYPLFYGLEEPTLGVEKY